MSRAPTLALTALALGGLMLCLAGLTVGSEGWGGIGPAATQLWAELTRAPFQDPIVWQIRAPRSLGAWCVGALLGLAGAIAQGLFRNPLADPYLLGSASGASLAVVLALSLGGWVMAGLVGAAFAGALAGMALTLLLSRGASHTGRLLLAGVVVGVMLSAASDWLTTLRPEVLRGRQGFLLGQTGLLDLQACAWLAAGLAGCLALSTRLSRVLDALALGEDTARSLGVDLQRWRAVLLASMALATGLAVSQAGLVAFVGLVAPHLARRLVGGLHAHHLGASALAGGALLLLADLLSRLAMAPQELPVGIVTAVLGGLYLLLLLHRSRPGHAHSGGGAS